ncbi:unnamed protein product [Rotaria sp. Silwood1]|nr:unnamed protein product [Rotaria sp. Silwood1]CAF1446431.1 unnamed protein product [Rotaria sp. Silwood1]CAF1446964.1 unnamed protein product [Rotaria sp. Silwood1]CAF3614787.1 unnamed protein product [Rotaria sp. Silwood1]CAF3625058.1 unnamed protein product [Rotaria sp. Silwood1]
MVDHDQQIRPYLLLTDSQVNSIAGATSGALASILVSPLDVVKTRIQVNRLPKGVRNTPLLVFVYRLGQQEGLRAFYKGLGATMLGYVPNWAVYFTIYQWSKKQFASYLTFIPYEHDVLINLFASVIAGAVSNTAVAPMWTIRTRMMTQFNHEDYRNSFHAAQKIYQTEGLYALYRGLIPSMMGLIHVGIQFPLYEYLKKKLAINSSSDQHLSIGQLMFASSISKLIASSLAYPHEIVRSRLQNAGHARHLQSISPTLTIQFREYKNVRDAVRTIAKEEGLRGFYRGLVPNLLRTVPSAILTLLSYEKMREFLTDNFGENSVDL